MTDPSFLDELQALIRQRLAAAPDGSYTAALAGKGILAIAQKLGEEGVELALAAVAQDDSRVIDEAADLLFHLLVLLEFKGISLAQVVATLEQRHRARQPR